MCSVRRGFTLLEALLTAVLLLLLLTLIVEIALSAGRASRRGAQQVALQQQGLQVLDQLGSALAGTPPEGVTKVGNTLCLQSLDGVTAQAEQLWQTQELRLFWSDARGLYTRAWQGKQPQLTLSPTDPFRPTAAQLGQLTTQGKLLVQDGVDFQVDWQPPLLSVHLKLTGGTVKSERLELDRSYYLFNERR